MSKVKLSDVATVAAGNVAPKAKDFTPDGIPFVRAGSLSGLLETGDFSQLETIDSAAASRLRLKLFPAGTVVFAKSGMSCLKGYVYTLPRECYVVSHLACITPNEGYSQYLKHYFRYWKPNRLVENPSFPSIKLSKISDIELDLPDGDHAQKIVDNLEAVLGAIDTEQLKVNKLDELVKSRFVEMFGDPVDEQSKWPRKPIKDFCELRIGPFGSALHKQDYIVGGHPLVNPSHIVDGCIVPSDELTISDEKYDEMDAYHLALGDVVLGRRGEIGRCAVVCDEGYLCGTGSMIVRPGQECRSDYLQRVLSFPSFKDALERNAVGQTMKNLNAKIVGNAVVALPAMQAQQEFAAFVQKVDKLKFETQQAIDKLQMLYDSLAQEYFGS